jgi:putative ABC transport system substrate-binding protein
MFNPQTAPYFSYYLQPFEAAARSRGLEPIAAPVKTDAEIESVIAGLSNEPRAGLAIMADIFVTTRHSIDLIVALAARHRVPTIYPYRYMVATGGLISYGVNNPDLFRRAAAYVDRILKGSRPADLPVQLPTRFELAVNLKTAKALGIEIPSTLLVRADEVIE